MDNFKKYSDLIVKSSFLFIIVSGIVFNVIFLVTGRETQGLDVVLITGLFYLAYLKAEKVFHEKLYFVPSAFYYVAIIFAFFATYLGSYLNFYEKFEIWDDILHFISGILLGVLCIILTSFVVIKRFGNISKKPDVVFMVVVGVLVSISVAVFWEFYECTYDFITDGNMQRSFVVPADADPTAYDISMYLRPSGRFVDPGLMDTMGDFFQAVAGAILSGIYCYFHYAKIAKNIEEYKIELHQQELEVKTIGESIIE